MRQPRFVLFIGLVRPSLRFPILPSYNEAVAGEGMVLEGPHENVENMVISTGTRKYQLY